MLTLAKMQKKKTQYFNVNKVCNLRLEYFESYSSFSYCPHKSVYRVFWPSCRVVDCNILILSRHSLLGQNKYISKNFFHPLFQEKITFLA